MARVKLTEYRAKRFLVDDYRGVGIALETLQSDLSELNDGTKYVIKVDQGVKKRGKQGLLRLNVMKDEAEQAVRELADKGFEQFIAEPMLAHEASEEKYLSIERLRDGFKFLYSDHGGVEVESNSDAIQSFERLEDVPLDQDYLKHVTNVMDTQYMSFLEINPLVIQGGKYYLLDAAVLVDSAGVWNSEWTEDDIAEARKLSEPEEVIKELNDNSPSSFSFRLINPNGAIWFMPNGGGASIVVADEVAKAGLADLIGNYGEYSGSTREETQVYTEAVLRQILASDAPKKVIVMAGVAANFTDVKKTFLGTIDAFKTYLGELKENNIKIFVRRGGPNQAEALKIMREFLTDNDLLGSVHDPSDLLTVAVDDAMEYMNA